MIFQVQPWTGVNDNENKRSIFIFLHLYTLKNLIMCIIYGLNLEATIVIIMAIIIPWWVINQVYNHSIKSTKNFNLNKLIKKTQAMLPGMTIELLHLMTKFNILKKERRNDITYHAKFYNGNT